MSEAYNAPAPTTGEYPLKLKRTRPPKPKKLQLPKSESKDLSNVSFCCALSDPAV